MPKFLLQWEQCATIIPFMPTSGPQVTTSDICHFWHIYRSILDEPKCKILALNTYQLKNTDNFYLWGSLDAAGQIHFWYLMNAIISAVMLHRPVKSSVDYHCSVVNQKMQFVPLYPSYLHMYWLLQNGTFTDSKARSMRDVHF